MKRLNEAYAHHQEISYDKPDPLLVATRYNDESIALLCALFSYGKASLIVKFLDSLDFSLLDQSDAVIKKGLAAHYYRFQNGEDIAQIFITIKRLKALNSVENIVYEGYKKENNLIQGVANLIETLNALNSHKSRGYGFLIGKAPTKTKGASAHKRLFMYLRWMVRNSDNDLGLWHKIDKRDLILPLDTHTFNVSQKLGLLERKVYDLHSALLITEALKKLDANDPIKYDFALYRIGQEQLLKDNP